MSTSYTSKPCLLDDWFGARYSQSSIIQAIVMFSQQQSLQLLTSHLLGLGLLLRLGRN